VTVGPHKSRTDSIPRARKEDFPTGCRALITHIQRHISPILNLPLFPVAIVRTGAENVSTGKKSHVTIYKN